MTNQRPDPNITPGEPPPCLNCGGRGWKYVTTRQDRIMAALDGLTLRASRRMCLDCTGTGESHQPDASAYRCAG